MITLQDQIQELRAELRGCSYRRERPKIAAELEAAILDAAIAALKEQDRAADAKGLPDDGRQSGAQEEPVAQASAGDRRAAVGSGISTNESVLRPEPALPAGEKARQADGAIGCLARFAAAFLEYRGRSSRYGGGLEIVLPEALASVNATLLILACAGILAGLIPHTRLGRSGPACRCGHSRRQMPDCSSISDPSLRR
jgi:hypothetical protein